MRRSAGTLALPLAAAATLAIAISIPISIANVIGNENRSVLAGRIASAATQTKEGLRGTEQRPTAPSSSLLLLLQWSLLLLLL